MRTLFTVTARVIMMMVLLLALTTTATAQKLTGVKKLADHTSEITVSSTGEGTKVDFTGHTQAFAGVITGTLNSNTIKFYCIDLNHEVNPSQHPVYWDEGATPAELTYILNNYFPANTSAYPNKLSDINKEAAAIQLAIWHFSDNLDANSITSDNAIKARTLAIIADAAANAGTSNPLQTLQIIPASQSVTQGGTASFTVKAIALDGTAMSGLTIQISTSGGTLSTLSATTGTNGITPAITLTNGNNAGSFVVTAKATVTLPQGTIYVDKTDANSSTKHQRIVLASPTTGTKEVTTTIVFSPKPSNCDLSKFTTFTQGGWGSPSNSTPGGIRDAYFASVFPNGLTVGGNHSIKLTSAAAVDAYLPDGGTAAVLTTNYINPTSQINVFAGQVVALTLNVAYSNAGYLGATTYKLGDLFIVSGTFAGKTVNQFLAIANNALGGANTGYTLSDINDAADAINNNFDNGTTDNHYLSCATSCIDNIGGFIYRDINTNGTKDAGEVGIAGVEIEILNGSTVVSTQTTDANGSYTVSNLSNATYTVRLAASNFTTGGVFFNTDQVKWYTKGTTSVNTTLSCNDNLAVNFGYYKTCVTITKTADKQTAKAGDQITYTFAVENCGDVVLHGGVQVKDVMVGLDSNFVLEPRTTSTFSRKYKVKTTDCDNLVNTVSAIGHPVLDYGTQSAVTLADVTSNATFTVVIDCKASLGDRVWIDTNKNGIQDAGEVGKAGVTVKLFTCAGDQVATTTTDTNGNYLFSNLTPGSYKVQFVLPANYVFTAKNASGSTSANDSDADLTSGETVCTTLTTGENDMTWDAGIYQQIASLGDRVWEDTNKNGIQDNGENGVSGVTVKLYTCAGVLVATTTTDGNGNYLFSNLAPNSYYVEFAKPAGYLFTSKDAGTNDAVDSDVDATTNRTICTTLDAGENDLTWDAGIYKEPVIEKADLKIEKSASSANPNCGDNVSYTIKVTNLGPNSASNVVVNDVLPAGLLYQSSSATVGSYNNTTGIWTVGTLANSAYATLTLNVKVDCTSMNSTSFDLGAAKGFNLFVIEDLNQPSSDTQGKVAVGHNATLSNYSVGDQLAANSGDVLVVGNNLSYTSGQVFNGNVVYGNATNLPQWSVSIAGSLTQASPIDFVAAKAYLQGLSTSLGNYTVNGTTTFQWGGLKLTGTDPFLNVFKVNGSDLSSANDFQIDVPNGSVVLVNIDGTNVSWAGGLVVNGTTINNVLYNFYQATNLSINGIDVRGSILAPFAALDFQSGVVNGQVIVKSMTGNGQFNLSLFCGNIPVDKVITNVASVSSSTVDDVTSNNIASAAITIGSTTNNGGGTGTGGTGNTGGGSTGGSTGGSWTNVCSFQGQIIYTLLYDGSSIYAGTMGGKIYKSTDNGTTWTMINSNMNVGFIWSFVKSGSSIFAATENGVYKYSGSTWTLTSLSGKDVHALTVNGNSIYAGTWGFGIYKSTNDGSTWSACNTGLDYALTVQSLTVYNGTVFAGTVGGGLFKSTDGASWSKAICGYQSIWAMSSTSSAIFAGTYGDGLYKSVDGGSSFTKLSSLSISFIYNVTTDASGKIYVSSLTNGVFVSSDNGASWSALGMGGYNVSSLMVNPKTSDVYAGTKDGIVYKMSGTQTTTGVADEAGIPTEFKLSQNYPNPFNPTTTIEFAIPAAGSYSLKVYDVLGQEVATLISNNLSVGTHKVNFDASRMASGMYIYRLVGNNVNLTKKMLLMK